MPRAAPLCGDGDPAQTELEGFFHRLDGEFVLAIPALGVGLQLSIGKLPAGIPQQPLLIGEFDLHVASLARLRTGGRVYTDCRPQSKRRYFFSAYLPGFLSKSGLQSSQQKA